MGLMQSCCRARTRALHSFTVSSISQHAMDMHSYYCWPQLYSYKRRAPYQCLGSLHLFVTVLLTFVCDLLYLAVLLAGLSQALVPSLNAAAERRRYDAVRTALTLLRHANAALQPSQHTSKPQAALANSGIGGRLLATQCAALLQGVLAELRSSRPHTGADSLGLGPGDWAALVTSLSAYPNTK